jgi:hypothetical protein
MDLECLQDGWTYYTDDPNWNEFYFAIEKGAPNAGFLPKVNLTLNPDLWGQPVIWHVQDYGWINPGSPGSNPYGIHGSFVMRRFWNVDKNGTSLAAPVKVRFYFSAQDSLNTIALRNTKIAQYTIPGPTPPAHVPLPTPWRWFKTEGIDFHPDLIYNGNIWGHFPHYLIPESDVTRGIHNAVRYVEFANITDFSGGSGGTGFGNDNPLLPVELISFTATARERDIFLEWLTATEINNEKFIVHRSIDGVNFAPIGEQPGAGTTNEPQQYVLVDEDVLYNQLYYYKLEQVDFDGTTKFSPIVTAIILRDISQIVVGELVPNPTVDVSFIDVIVPEDMKINMRVLNMLGQEMASVENIALPRGSQRIHIDATYLAKGNYLVTFEFENGYVASRKMIVIE